MSDTTEHDALPNPDAPATIAAAPEQPQEPGWKTGFHKIPLTTPIKRGETEITEVIVRRPMGGDLRGCSPQGLLNVEIDTMFKVLPRVTMPPLLLHELEQSVMPADLMEMVAAVKDFFTTPEERAFIEQMQARAREQMANP
jgi:hypothetical protein